MPPSLFIAPGAFAESLVLRGADIAASWLLTYLVHSTVILLAAWVLTSRARMSDVVREVVWKFALVGGLVTASVQTAIAREPLAGQLSLAGRTAGPAPDLRITLRGTPAEPARRFVVSRPRGTQWTAALVVLWLTSSGAGLLWLTARHARTLRVLGDRSTLDDTEVRARLDALLARAGVRKRVTLTSSSSIASPLALSGDEVCLPRRALLELTPNEQEGMLAHEVAHLVRRDPQWLILARTIETVLFMQPLNRLARHHMQEVAEFLCDDWAVSRVSQPVTLAKCLAAVAEWVGRAPRVQVPRLHPMSAMVESAGSPLVRRVGRILNARTAPRARTPRLAFSASAAALLGLIAVAPRISVANPVAHDRLTTFVRAVAAPRGPAGAVLRRDSVIVLRARSGLSTNIAVDSLVRQRRLRMPAGTLTGTANVVIIERMSDR